MKGKRMLIGGLLAALLLALVAGLSLAREPESRRNPSAWGGSGSGTAFTYQGLLRSGGRPVNDTCDFRFSLWDAESGGSQIGSTQLVDDVDVTDGLFTVQLDFGSGAFTGEARWLKVEVKCSGDSDYVELTPLQPISPAPYALALPGLWTQPNDTSPNLIGGYSGNSVTDGVVGGTIGGGGASSSENQVTDNYGTVGGGYFNRAGNNDDNPANANYATVGGGAYNTASGTAATVGGGYWNTASGGNAAVGGGYHNTASDWFATVGGGWNNAASAQYATVGGGRSNTASGYQATVGGGYYNQATADYATIAGGGPSNPSNPGSTNNVVYDNYGTIGGGGYNRAGSDDGDSTTATYATVGGGYHNTASGYQATVGGGYWNTASGSRATVGGGYSNTASGASATVPGGSFNTASGDYSFAAGRRAKADDDGAFVWADSQNADIYSPGNDTFIVRAQGGIWFGTDSSPSIPSDRFINTSTGGYLSTGGQWTDSSDRNAKENFEPVDPDAVLEGVIQLPITTWNYKAEDDAIRHMGPTAQDFYAAFGLGADDKHIAPLDASGVALAAIQGLYRQNQDLRAENAQLRARVEALEQENAAQQAQIEALEARVAALEQGSPLVVRQGGVLPGAGLALLGLGAALVVRRSGGGR